MVLVLWISSSGLLSMIGRPADNLRSVHGGASQHFERRHTAARQHPQLPVIADPLHLAVAADAHQATGTLELGHLRRKLRKFILVLAEPSLAALGSLVDDPVWHEVI